MFAASSVLSVLVLQMDCWSWLVGFTVFNGIGIGLFVGAKVRIPGAAVGFVVFGASVEIDVDVVRVPTSVLVSVLVRVLVAAPTRKWVHWLKCVKLTYVLPVGSLSFLHLPSHLLAWPCDSWHLNMVDPIVDVKLKLARQRPIVSCVLKRCPRLAGMH